MAPMTEQRERYDRIGDAYARWWAPVLAPTATVLLDLVDDAVRAGARELLDIGTGTGTLALAAVARWPTLRVTGIDTSGGMLARAEREARDRVAPADLARLTFRQASADSLPLADGCVDVVVSSFVLQLVPSRLAALREANRVLRPGGRLAYVTWLAGDSQPYAGDDAFDAALATLGLDPRGTEDDARPGDVPSTGSALRQLRRAGFRRARAATGQLRHAFSPETFLGFLAEFDEEELFRTLEPPIRASLEQETLARLRALEPDALRLELPVVFVSGDRHA
jgi:SAM-dependent methyltransferase